MRKYNKKRGSTWLSTDWHKWCNIKRLQKKKKLNKARLLKKDTTRACRYNHNQNCATVQMPKTHVRLKRTLKLGSLEQLLSGSSENPSLKHAPNTRQNTLRKVSKKWWLYKMKTLHSRNTVVQCCTPKSLSVLPEWNATDVEYITESMHNKKGRGNKAVVNRRHSTPNNADWTCPMT